MSEEALFIKSLNVERVRLNDRHSYCYYSMSSPYTAVFQDKVFNPSEAVRHEVVDIHEFCRHDRGSTTRTLIAYSREVEELIGIPFSILKKENNDLRHENGLRRLQINRFRRMSFLDRLLFLLRPSNTMKLVEAKP